MSQGKRILLIGATGIIGKAVDQALKQQHEVIRAGIADCDINFDFSDRSLYSLSALPKE